ncbi:MAG: NUDIX domain-containing protein [Pseudomonadota bacterium]
MTQYIFLYDQLCDHQLYSIVAGLPLEGAPAHITGQSTYSTENPNCAVLLAAPNGTAKGILADPGEAARSRIDFYKSALGYTLEQRMVETATGPVQADVYVSPPKARPNAPWSLSDWQTRHGTLARLVATELIGLRLSHTVEAANRSLPQIEMRAASRLRAEHAAPPSPLAPRMSDAEVYVERTERPYTDYFAVREDWLSFPHFSRGQSDVVKRASFLGGDAVTVLPYDPALESVLIIRQFRHGAFARGDKNPWTLEPAAGRIDVGEAPEATAARELQEETGVTAQSLHFVGQYYPSPGAYSEYLYSYVACADLSSADGGIGGLEAEAEDIMRHVIPLDEALALIETGAANTGPLVLSLGWLALNKGKLA